MGFVCRGVYVSWRNRATRGRQSKQVEGPGFKVAWQSREIESNLSVDGVHFARSRALTSSKLSTYVVCWCDPQLRQIAN